MNKAIINRKIYNQSVVNKLMRKYGVSKRMVHYALNKERDSETAESIRKDYPKMVEAIRQALDKKPKAQA